MKTRRQYIHEPHGDGSMLVLLHDIQQKNA